MTERLSAETTERRNRYSDPYPEPRALAEYAARVGAERRNFRRYVIRETQRDLYHYDRYIIIVGTDGAVTVREARGDEVPDEVKPTEDEAAKIKEAVSAVTWPKSIAAASISALRQIVGDDAELFVFEEPERSILFVQKRRYDDEGGKTDLPWTFWSDGNLADDGAGH
jgi:hypothetical protein